MADLLNILGLAGVAGAKAQTATLEGEQIKREREQKDLLARLAQQRQSAQDAEDAKRSDLLNRLTEAQIARTSAPEPERPRRTQVVDGQLVDLDAGTAMPIQGYQAPAPKVTSSRTPERGTPEYLQMLKDEAMTRASVAPARTTLPTEGERKAAAFYASGKQGYDTLEALLGDDPATPMVEKQRAVPGWLAQQAAKVGFGAGNVMTNDQVRRMRQSALMLSDAWLRYTSGAAVPETEVERFAESFIPRAGDDETTLAQKRDARRVIIEALRKGAGRALDPNAQGTQGPQDGLDALINAELGRQP